MCASMTAQAGSEKPEWLYLYCAETTAEEVVSSLVCLVPNKSFMPVSRQNEIEKQCWRESGRADRE